MDSSSLPPNSEPDENNFFSEPEPEKSGGSDRGWLWLFIVLLMIVGGLAGWLIMQSRLAKEAKSRLPSSPPAVKSDFNSPSMESVKKLVQEVRSGVLPAIGEDLIIGAAGDLMMRDQRLLISHAATQRYLEKVLAFVQKKSVQTHVFYPIRIHVHEDRWRYGFNSMPDYAEPEVGILPHGLIFFGVSMILDAKSEAEIAAALAHEIGHVIFRHIAQDRLVVKNIVRLKNQYAQARNQLGLNTLESVWIYLMGVPTLGWEGLLKNEQQREADLKSQEILIEAGYDFSVMFNGLSRTIWERNKQRVDSLKKRSEQYYKNHPRGKLFLVVSPKEFARMQASLNDFLLKQTYAPSPSP